MTERKISLADRTRQGLVEINGFRLWLYDNRGYEFAYQQFNNLPEEEKIELRKEFNRRSELIGLQMGGGSEDGL